MSDTKMEVFLTALWTFAVIGVLSSVYWIYLIVCWFIHHVRVV